MEGGDNMIKFYKDGDEEGKEEGKEEGGCCSCC